ncbi:hypothetical protein [Flavobacterium sp. JAS]|nr:hypothetical protein [Flavobacterium sp. JAS]
MRISSFNDEDVLMSTSALLLSHDDRINAKLAIVIFSVFMIYLS